MCRERDSKYVCNQMRLQEFGGTASISSAGATSPLLPSSFDTELVQSTRELTILNEFDSNFIVRYYGNEP